MDDPRPGAALETRSGPPYRHFLVALKNPSEGFLSAENWIGIAEQLQLSGREMCAAVLLFEGNTRFQIARKLRCAPGTARVYIDRLYAKLNVRDRVGLVLRVVRVHLANCGVA